jgi:starch synthase
MKIAMLSSEIAPFAKTGGLADVLGTLSPALEKRGHEITLIMPAYRSVLNGPFTLEATGMPLAVPLGPSTVEGSVLEARLGQNIPVFLVRADRYFDRDYLYGTPHGDYPDNAERFAFFCRAALAILSRRPPEIVHCHDWQAALAIVFLIAQRSRYPELASARTVLTAHNLGFQGIFRESNWPLLNLDRSYFSPQHLEFFGNINFLKGGLIHADKITTVSPSYAQEIMSAEQGFGLQGILQQRAADLMGILNGVDYNEWSPETDLFIARRYDENELTGKRICKDKLQGSLGLPVKSAVPLFGMVSRLTSQKGFDLVEKIFDQMMERELQLVLLGSGELRYEDFFATGAARFPEKFAVRKGFDEALAHRIEAGADIFLMPSLYEPCGLNQMFSLKYGTIPIVRAVGGLKDTVMDCNADPGKGTGFVFDRYEPNALWECIERALRLFADNRSWTALIHRAMRMDFSWDRSAQAYSDLYEQLLR